ncbi:ATP-grasp domain-containing protein [Thalassoglobus sp. JC818]|uniref:ATP-grasp domain-containing protein n=1 Tax=Thalassoglobus sp. JC818 TaxID=3232136 RepID=UPI0034597B57
MKTSIGGRQQPRILIGFADAISAPEVVWSLIDSGFSVVVFQRKATSCSLRWSRFVEIIEITAPEVSVLQCQEELVTVYKRHCFDAVLPLDDQALLVCSSLNKDGTLIPLACADGANASFALDKRLQIQVAVESGMDVPETHFIQSVDDLRIENIAYPVIFKPAMAARVSGNKVTRGKAYYCNDGNEMAQAVKVWNGQEPMLLQPILHGQGVGVFGIAKHGKALHLIGHSRIRMMNPHGSGSSACQSIEVVPTLAEQVRRFISKAEWHGLFMVETLMDESENYWFMELNGRPWGSMALARSCGFEYPSWTVQQKLGAELSPPPPENCSHKICRNLGREIVHLIMVVRGPQSDAIQQWPSVTWTILRLLKWTPFQSWYSFRWSDPMVFVLDTLLTLKKQVFDKLRSR